MGGKSIEEQVKDEKGISIHGHSLRISFQYQGTRFRETLGLEPTKPNLRYAANLRAAVLHDINTGVFDYAKRFPNSKNASKFGGGKSNQSISVGELAERFLKLKEPDIGIQSIGSYANAMNECVSTLGRDRLISTITGEDILLMRNTLISSRKASTVNNYLIVFKPFLEFSYDNEYISMPIHKSAKPFKENDSEPDPFEMEEFEDIINLGCINDVYKNIITLLVYTGMRIGEAFSLCWEDIDIEKKTITVKRNITEDRLFKLPKNDLERTVYLMPPVVDALKLQRLHTFMAPAITIQVHKKDKRQTKQESVRPVFRSGYGTKPKNKKNTDEWYTAESFRSNWRRIAKRSGIRYREMYQTRHTYACWGLTSHGNVAFIANQLGHKDLNMVIKRYGKWMDSSSKNESDFIWSELHKKGHELKKMTRK